MKPFYKARKWIVEKLGGTMFQIENPFTENFVRTHDMPLTKYRAVGHVSSDRWSRDPIGTDDIMRKRLTNDLLNQIASEYKFQMVKDVQGFEIIYQMDAYFACER